MRLQAIPSVPTVAVAQATLRMPGSSHSSTSATPVAAAKAVCPEGNEVPKVLISASRGRLPVHQQLDQIHARRRSRLSQRKTREIRPAPPARQLEADSAEDRRPPQPPTRVVERQRRGVKPGRPATRDQL